MCETAALLQLVRLFWCEVSWCHYILQRSRKSRFSRRPESSLQVSSLWAYQVSSQLIVTAQQRGENSHRCLTSRPHLLSLSSLVFSLTGSRMLEYDGSAWHEDCFMCHGCDKPIGAEAFIPDKNNYYCVPCYEGRFAPQCSHCKKVNQTSRTP